MASICLASHWPCVAVSVSVVYPPTGLDWIGAYPTMLMTSGCARLLDWSRRRLMPVMSYHNPHLPCAVLSCHADGHHEGVMVKSSGHKGSVAIEREMSTPPMPRVGYSTHYVYQICCSRCIAYGICCLCHILSLLKNKNDLNNQNF